MTVNSFEWKSGQTYKVEVTSHKPKESFDANTAKKYIELGMSVKRDERFQNEYRYFIEGQNKS